MLKCVIKQSFMNIALSLTSNSPPSRDKEVTFLTNRLTFAFLLEQVVNRHHDGRLILVIIVLEAIEQDLLL